jgi:surface antigen
MEAPPFIAPGKVGSGKAGGSLAPGNCRYPTGQCTWYIAQQYPVLQQQACMGNACQWWAFAKAHGWQTTQTAFVGGVVVYNCNLPGWGGQTGFGHVAIVTSINKDGSFDVMEANWQNQLQIDSSPRRVFQGDGSSQYISGFIAIPTGPTPEQPGSSAGNNQNQTNNCTPSGVATGANGGPCQVPLTINGLQVSIPAPSFPPFNGPWNFCIGGWVICMDGVLGALSMTVGAGIIILGVALAVKNPVEKTAGVAAQAGGRATEVAGAVSGQPEVVAAGQKIHQGGKAVRAHVDQKQLEGRQRTFSSQRLSVQQQQTRRQLMDGGMTSVQATHAARAGQKALPPHTETTAQVAPDMADWEATSRMSKSEFRAAAAERRRQNQ